MQCNVIIVLRVHDSNRGIHLSSTRSRNLNIAHALQQISFSFLIFPNVVHLSHQILARFHLRLIGSM